MKNSTGRVKFNKAIKKWEVRITYTEQETGKRRNVSRRFKTREEADTLLDIKRQQIRAKTIQPVANVKLTMSDFIDRCLEEHFCKAEFYQGQRIKGVQSYESPRSYAKHVKAYFESRPVRSIGVADLRAFREYLTKLPTENTGGKRAISSINHVLNFLRTCFRYGVRHEIVENNPFQKAGSIVLPNPDGARSRVFTFGEEMALLKHCVSPRAHLRSLIILAADTGMRRGEILALQYDWIDWTRNTINLPAEKTKTKRARIIQMTARVQELLNDATKQQQTSKKVFEVAKIQAPWGTARKYADIKDGHFHDWRHTFLTRCVTINVPLPVIVKQTGHVSDEWQRYLNPERVNEMFTPLPGQTAEEVEVYAKRVLLGLRDAMGFEKINRLLGD